MTILSACTIDERCVVIHLRDSFIFYSSRSQSCHCVGTNRFRLKFFLWSRINPLLKRKRKSNAYKNMRILPFVISMEKKRDNSIRTIKKMLLCKYGGYFRVSISFYAFIHNRAYSEFFYSWEYDEYLYYVVTVTQWNTKVKNIFAHTLDAAAVYEKLYWKII